LKSTIIYFTNGIDFFVPRHLILTYFAYILKFSVLFLAWPFILFGETHLGYLLLGAWFADYKFFTDIIEVHLFFEED
jgi:hypothetical protein